MTAAEWLDRCRAHHVDLARGEDGTLKWEADDDPPADLLPALAENKAARRPPTTGPSSFTALGRHRGRCPARRVAVGSCPRR